MKLQHRNTNNEQLWEEFLGGTLPVQVIACLQYPKDTSLEQWDASFASWINSIERDTRTTLGYIRSYEHGLDISLHLHAALVAARKLDTDVVRCNWLKIVGPHNVRCVTVQDYVPAGGGLGYLSKAIDEDDVRCESAFSDNIRLFSSLPGVSDPASMSARDRRSYQRIQEQLAA
jgi:hypothetical protein